MNRDDSRLVLRDIPIFLWLIGLIFACVGVFILSDRGPAPAMGLIFVAIGLGVLLFVGVLTITADRITRTLKLESRSALRHRIKQFSFDEITGITVERSLSHGRGRAAYTYQLAIVRKDGQVIPFRSFSSSGSRKKERQAGRLRDFIGVQAYDRGSAAALSRFAEIRETDGVRWQVQPMILGDSTGTRWHSPDFKTPGVFLFVAQKAEGQATRGFLASLGAMFFRQSIAMYGFRADDTPGLNRAAGLSPLDPALEHHYMAFTNDPASARAMLNSRAVPPLAAWAGRYPLNMLRKGSPFGQLAMLFSPNGAYLATMNPLPPELVTELAALGVELVKSQRSSRADSSSSSSVAGAP